MPIDQLSSETCTCIVVTVHACCRQRISRARAFVHSHIYQPPPPPSPSKVFHRGWRKLTNLGVTISAMSVLLSITGGLLPSPLPPSSAAKCLPYALPMPPTV